MKLLSVWNVCVVVVGLYFFVSGDFFSFLHLREKNKNFVCAAIVTREKKYCMSKASLFVLLLLFIVEGKVCRNTLNSGNSKTGLIGEAVSLIVKKTSLIISSQVNSKDGISR